MARSSGMVIPEILQPLAVRMFQEKVDIFNAASGGCITLSYDKAYLDKFGGDFRKPVQFARPSGTDTHADEADPASADTAVAITQAKGATVFQSRRAYMYYTRDEMLRGTMSKSQYTNALAEFIADYKIKAIRDNLIASGVAAMDSMDTPSANYHISDVAVGSTAGAKVKLTYARLNVLLSKMKDARPDITLLVMPSELFHDLVGDNIATYQVDTVAGAMMVQGTLATFGCNLLVADISAFTASQTSSYYTEYSMLGLGAGALSATIISEDPVDLDTITTTKIKKFNFFQKTNMAKPILFLIVRML